MLTQTDKLDAKNKGHRFKGGREEYQGVIKQHATKRIKAKMGYINHKQRDRAVQKRKMNNPSRVLLRVVVPYVAVQVSSESNHPIQNSTK